MKDMKRIIVLLIFLVLVPLFKSDFDVAWNNLKSLLLGVWAVIYMLIKIALKYPSELGLIDLAYTWVIYFIIFISTGALGVYLSKNTKSKIFSIISFVVSTVSLIVTIVGLSK